MKKDRIISFWLFLFMLTIYLITMAGHFYTTDEEMHYRLIESMVERQTFSIEMNPDEEWAKWNTVKGIDGKLYSKSGIGQSIGAIPFYLLGKGISLIFRIPTNRFMRLSVSFFNQFVTAILSAIMFLFLCKLGYSTKSSVLTALVLGLCTMVWPYAKLFLNMPLASLLLFFSFFLLCSPDAETNKSKIIFAGLFFGFSLLVRHDMLIFYPAFLSYFLFTKSTRWRFIILFSAGMLIVFPTIFWYNFIRTGSLFATGYSPEENFSNPFLIGVWGFLFSPAKSIFLYSPPLLISFLLLWRFFKKHRNEAIFIVCGFIISLMFYSKWFNWEGGRSWGPRFMFLSMVLLTVPIVKFFENRQKWNRSFNIVILGIFLTGFIVQILAVMVNSFQYFNILDFMGVQIGETYSNFLFSPIFIQWMIMQKMFASHGWKGLDLWFLRGSVYRLLFLCVLVLFLFLSGIKLRGYISYVKETHE